MLISKPHIHKNPHTSSVLLRVEQEIKLRFLMFLLLLSKRLPFWLDLTFCSYYPARRKHWGRVWVCAFMCPCTYVQASHTPGAPLSQDIGRVGFWWDGDCYILQWLKDGSVLHLMSDGWKALTVTRITFVSVFMSKQRDIFRIIQLLLSITFVFF